MRILVIDDTRFKLPQSWNELSDTQLLYVAELCQEQIPKPEFLLKTLLFCTGLRVKQNPIRQRYAKKVFRFTNGKQDYVVSPDIIASIYTNFLFLLKENKSSDEIHYEINTKRTKPIGIIKHQGQSYYGPADSLTNLTVHEFIFSETYYSNWVKTKNNNQLDLFIATLYRPAAEDYNIDDPRTTGDPREEFNDFLIEKRAETLKSLPFHYKTAIRWYYEGSRAYIQKKFMAVHSGGGTPGKQEDVFEGFMKLVNALANHDITKNDRVRKSNLYEAMINLNEMMSKPKQ